MGYSKQAVHSRAEIGFFLTSMSGYSVFVI